MVPQLDADIAAFRADGYVKLGALLPEATLHQLQVSFRREQALWRSVHEGAQRSKDRDWRSSGYFDVPRVLETDDAYLGLLGHPRLVALLRAAVGEDVMVEHVQARTLLPVASHTERDWNSGGSYTGWHNDGGNIGLADHPTLAISAKLFFALSDQDESSGCTCIVPRTHDKGYLMNSANRPGAQLRAGEPVDAMPGNVPLRLAAGEACLLDIRTFHAAMPNTSHRDRESIIIQYCPFRRKQEWFTAFSASRLHAAGKLSNSQVLRQLLGIALDFTTPMRRIAEPLGPNITTLTRVKMVPEEVVLEPPLPPNPASPSFPEPPPPELQEDIASFRRKGFLHLRQVISGEQLAQVQAAFAREKSAAQGQRWEALRADSSAEQAQTAVVVGNNGVPGAYRRSSFFDVPVDLEADTVYLNVIAQPELCRLVEELVGSGMQCNGIGGRVVPPESETTNAVGDDAEGKSGVGVDGHSTWHREFSRTTVTQLHEHGPFVDHHQMSETVKAFLAVQEQTVDDTYTGSSSTSVHVFEGSHLYVQEPGSTPRDTVAMKGTIMRFDAQPGDVLLMDQRTWHTTLLPNRSQRDRETLIFSYTGSEARNACMRERGLRLRESGALAAHGGDGWAAQVLGLQRRDGQCDQFRDMCGLPSAVMEAVVIEEIGRAHV